MDGVTLTVTASSLVFGFLFAGFWWALDRELKFPEEKRHFKYAYGLLLGTMAVVGLFGILRPLWQAAKGDATVSGALPGVVAALIGIFGYMLTEFGHYGVYQRPKYSTPSERILFWLTIVAIMGTGVWGVLR
jgi:quinol-cytochrome oxidoreductase complex cytochrome b subunit